MAGFLGSYGSTLVPAADSPEADASLRDLFRAITMPPGWITPRVESDNMCDDITITCAQTKYDGLIAEVKGLPHIMQNWPRQMPSHSLNHQTRLTVLYPLLLHLHVAEVFCMFPRDNSDSGTPQSPGIHWKIMLKPLLINVSMIPTTCQRIGLFPSAGQF